MQSATKNVHEINLGEALCVSDANSRDHLPKVTFIESYADHRRCFHSYFLLINDKDCSNSGHKFISTRLADVSRNILMLFPRFRQLISNFKVLFM